MEEGGAKRIVVIIAVAAVAILGVFWYWQRSKQRALGSGNVYVKNQTSDQSAALSAPPSPDAAQTANSAAPAATDGSSSSSAPQSGIKPSAGIEKTVHAAQSAPEAQPPVSQPPMTQPRGALEVPASDTIPRNPPSGLIFAGAGKYQLYRQGDITWRLDTDNGRACIIFATDTQWSRTRVYDQGCGAS